jgi:DNA-binding CsgD family transcriptional regulator
MQRPLLEKDARELVRLVGEAAVVAATENYKASRASLLNGLSRLIDADAWGWMMSRVDPVTHQIYYLVPHTEGIGIEELSALTRTVEHPTCVEAAKGFGQALMVTQKPITMNRLQIDPENLIYQGEVAEIWKETGFESLIFSGHPLDEESFSQIAIYRKQGKPEFGMRETQMAHIVLSEVPWLHALGWPQDRGVSIPKLTPRQRVVMNLLTDGMSRKEMANVLGISEGTVSGYVREVYKHFGVRSQTALVKKFSGAF